MAHAIEGVTFLDEGAAAMMPGHPDHYDVMCRTPTNWASESEAEGEISEAATGTNDAGNGDNDSDAAAPLDTSGGAHQQGKGTDGHAAAASEGPYGRFWPSGRPRHGGVGLQDGHAEGGSDEGGNASDEDSAAAETRLSPSLAATTLSLPGDWAADLDDIEAFAATFDGVDVSCSTSPTSSDEQGGAAPASAAGAAAARLPLKRLRAFLVESGDGSDSNSEGEDGRAHRLRPRQRRATGEDDEGKVAD